MFRRWMPQSVEALQWRAARENAKQRELQPIYNVRALFTDLKSCCERRDVLWGRRIHAKAVQSGNGSHSCVWPALIKMYAKCGSMACAHGVFNSIQNPSVASWTALLLGYAENGEGHVALELFSKMKAHGHLPDAVSYLAALKACTSLVASGDGRESARHLEMGRQIHSEIGDHLNSYLQSTLVDMYAKSGSMIEARQVFESIKNPDVVPWSALILGYAENGQGHAALELFSKMKADGCVPNAVTYVAALKACTSLAVDQNGNGLERGRQMHLEIGDQVTPFVQSTLIDMYSKCGSMVEARRVFDSARRLTVVCWNALLMGYADNGEGHVALDMFYKMGGCSPNAITYVAALKACTSLAVNGGNRVKEECLERGRRIHKQIDGQLNPYVQSTLIDMYTKCGSMADARRVFDNIKKPDVIAWSALLLGYAENGEGQVALDLFFKMKTDGCIADTVAYVAALKACTSLAVNGDGLERGREIHSEIGDKMTSTLQNTLVDMYAKCGSMVDARQVFDSIQKPSLVSWSALIMGYVENGDEHVALELFSEMTAHGCVPDSVTYIAVLKACGLTGALVLGRRIHSDIRDFTPHVVTCLVDFYAKCGSMVEAHAVFDRHSSLRNITTCTALLAGYSICGDTETVFSLFEAMQDMGFRPDGVTFLCMLLCCSHAGLVEKAMEYFKAMHEQHMISPTVVHYNCMLDVLGRANQLHEALSVLRDMPCSPNAVTWTALLGACHKWKNVEIGRMAFDSLVEMDKTAYVLMAQIYGNPGVWEESRVHSGACKQLEQAYVADDVGRMVKFQVGGEDPPGVRDKLAQLLQGMKEHGFNNVLSEQEVLLCGHCERRAIVYGILNTAPGEPVRAFKNTRMCEGCHESAKMFSKLSERVIMVRDSSRFHVMRSGSCSCGDKF